MMDVGSQRAFPTSASRVPSRLYVATLVAVVLAVYANALPAGYVFDDPFYLRIASGVRSPHDLFTFFTKPLRLDPVLAPVETQVYRPLYFVYGAVAYRLWGDRAWAWHAANIALHGLTACLVLFALRRLFGLSDRIAFMTSLIWAVHPVHVQVVTWVAAVAYLLMGCFLLIAVLVASVWWPATWPRSARAPTAVGAFAISVLNHELGVMAPALAALALAYAPTGDRVRGRPLDRGAVVSTSVLGVAALGYLFFRFSVIGAGQAGGSVGIFRGLGGRLLQAPEILLRNLALLAFPVRLTVDRTQDVAPPMGLLDARPVAAVAACLFLVWGVARLGRRLPAVAFGAAWFFVAYLPTSNTAIPLYSVMGEQYLYIASVGTMAGTVVAVHAVALRRRMSRAAALAGVLIAAAYGARAAVRNRDWSDDFTFNQATVAASPRSAVFHNNLGNSYARRGDSAAAEREYRMALALNPSFPKAHYNLGTVALERGDLDAAEESFRRAVALRPDYFSPLYSLALVAHRRGKTQDEITWLERGLALQPNHADAQLNLGVAYLGVDQARAAEHLRRFLDLAPVHPEAAAVRARLSSLPTIEGR